MSDYYWRSTLGKVYRVDLDLGDTPWVTPRPLSEARVAIVTTAGLRSEGKDAWEIGDFGFSVLPREARELTMAQASSNFDRSGFLADLNVVYPIDRLEELAEDGRIGSVAPRHLSFSGGQTDFTLETLRLDTGPAAAQFLVEDDVDVVLLTPV